jgi:hypothetical protein
MRGDETRDGTAASGATPAARVRPVGPPVTGELPPAVERTCRRCGADARGAAWCPACGLNLRADAPAVPTRAPAAHGRLSGGVFVSIVVVALVAVAGIAAALILATGGQHATQTVVRVLRARPAANTLRAAPAAQPIGVTEIAGLLSDYQNAYTAEEVVRLAQLFTPDMQRQNGNDLVENRAQALDTYQRQFDALNSPHYRLSHVRYLSDANGVVVNGSYSIVSAEGTATGQIAFHLVRRNGRPMIDAIRTVPTQ